MNRKLIGAGVIGCVLSVILAACGGGGGAAARPVVHASSAPRLHGVNVLSRTYSLSPAGPLPAPQSVTLPLSQPAPAGEELVVATAEQSSGPWTYLPVALSSDRGSVTFTVTHHSLFTVLGLSAHSLVREFETQFLDGLDSGATTVVDPPSCASQAAARQGYHVTSSSGPTVYWCLGMDSGKRILKIVNDRHYPLLIAHQGLTEVERTGIDYSQFSSLSHFLSGYQSVLASGAEVGYRVTLSPGQEVTASTQLDGFGQSLYALQVGLSTMTKILTRFGFSEAPKLVEAIDKALTDDACVNALIAANPGAILSGCFDAAKLITYFGTVGLLLAPIAAAGGVVAFFQNEWQGMRDNLTNQDTYEISVSRPAGGPVGAKPAGSSPGSGGTGSGSQPPPSGGSGGAPSPASNAGISIGWSSAHPGWITMTMQHFPTGTYTYSCDSGSGGDASFSLTETSEPQAFDNGHTCYDKVGGDTVWVTIGSVRSNTLTVATPAPPPPADTYAETVGGVTHTWTNYVNAGGTEGPSIAAYRTVQVACKVTGFRVADGDTWWYRIASSPWNRSYYASADAFYNDGRTSGSRSVHRSTTRRYPTADYGH